LDDPSFLKNPPPRYDLFRKHWPDINHKHTKTGLPVFYLKVGPVAVELINKNFSEDEIKSFTIYRSEDLTRHILDAATKFKKPIETNVGVWDFKGLNWSHRHLVNTFKFSALLTKEHFVERVEKLIFINVPWIFPALFKMVKPFVDSRTLHKIEIVQGPAEKRLKEFIDEDDLPVEYGGKCKCEGGCVPHVSREMLEKELEMEKKDLEKEHPDMKEQVVAARYQSVVSVHSGGYLEEERKNKDFGFFGWCVKLANYDIKLSITFTPDDAKASKQTVLAETRCKDHEGSFTALEPGRLDVTLDNTYSRLRSKTVQYNIFFATQHDHEDKEKESVETVAAKKEQEAVED